MDALTASYDSVSADYDTLYTVLKEKVFKVDFNPSDLTVMIDTLRAKNEDAFAANTTSLSDSISVLAEENIQLKEEIEGMKGDADEETMNDLKQLKELLDEEIITQEEFDTKKAVLLENL